MGLIKDKNCTDLTEAEDTKKRWQEYTEELYRKDLHDQDNHKSMITHLEPDILECEVKWALKSITTNKASGGDGISVELFQILKDDAVKVLCSIASKCGKLGLKVCREALELECGIRWKTSAEPAASIGTFFFFLWVPSDC